MKKIIAHCGLGFCGAEHEDELEFEDDVTEEEINKEVWMWAGQFLDVWWEESEEEDD